MRFGVRDILFLLLLVSIPLGAWWFVFRPQNARNAEMLSQIEARQTKLRALSQTTAMIGDLQTEIASLEKGINFFQSKLPNEKEMDQVLQEVWRLAEANRLVTKSIRTLQKKDEPGAAPGPNEQPISVQFEGDFTGFYSFLLALETQPRIMRISQMTLKKLDKAGEGMMQASFVMSIFFESGKEKPWPATKS
jgi:Tfp pilus assembly protein PilO